MGQQQSSDKYNRKINYRDQYYRYDYIDNVNDNVKGKKNSDKISRINDLLYNSKTKSEHEDHLESKKRNQLDFNDNSRTINLENYSDNALRHGRSSNAPIPRAHVKNNYHYSSSMNSSLLRDDSSGEVNNYPVTFTPSSLPSSSANGYHINENRRSLPVHIEEYTNNNNTFSSNNNDSEESINQPSTSANVNDSITQHWGSNEHQSNYPNNNNNENDDEIHPNALNIPQDSRILIIEDTTQASNNNSSHDNNDNSTNPDSNEEVNNNLVTLRTTNSNGQNETAIIYQNTNNNASSSTSRGVSSAQASSSTTTNNNRNTSMDNSSPSTSSPNDDGDKKKNKIAKTSLKNKYKETTSVSLSYQNLTILPNYIFELKNLVFLDITHNSLRELPSKLFKLKNLKKLACSDNLIEQVPNEIDCLKKLTWLDFTHNRIQSIPETIGSLTELAGLGLSDCRLTKLPYSIKNLKKLTKLGVFNNNITWIPPEIGCLENLIKLDLSSNKLQKIPVEIKFLKNLQWLNLSDNKLKELPTEMNELKNLKELGLGHNFLRYIPDLSNLRKLVMLPIYSNQLEYIGNWICNMRGLEKLDLSDNRLTFIPPGIFKLPKLNYLNLKNNQLRHVACDFALYSSFSQIDLSNSFELIKDDIIDKNIIVYPYLNNLPFTKLDFLDISHNSLSYVPAILTKLTISTMKFKHNAFNSLFTQCSTDFNIKYNPNLSPKLPVIKCKDICLKPSDNNHNDLFEYKRNFEEDNNKAPLSFFDELLIEEQIKNNNKNNPVILSLPSRSMDITLSSKESLTRTFTNNEYIEIIPSKSFPSLASLCINHLFKKYSKRCNARLCKFRNDHINSTYSFVKLCDTISNSNVNQSISSSEESIYYNEITTPKDLKYLGSINDLNITLRQGQGYYDYMKQSDLSYLSSKLQRLISKDKNNDRSGDTAEHNNDSSNSRRINNSSNYNYSSASSSSTSHRNSTASNNNNNNSITSPSTIVSSPPNDPSYFYINDNNASSSSSSSSKASQPTKSRNKQQIGITKLRNYIGKNSSKNEKEKEKGKGKEKEKKMNQAKEKSKKKQKDKQIMLEERAVRENDIKLPLYNNNNNNNNNHMITMPLRSKITPGYQGRGSINDTMEINIRPTSIPNSSQSLYTNSTSNSMNSINRPVTNCLHALYSLIKTLPEFTQYAFKHALICDVCGNNYVTNESLQYFRSQYHQSIRSLAKKTISPSPYLCTTDEHLNIIEEEDIQNIIQDYGSLRILHWKIQEPSQNSMIGDEMFNTNPTQPLSNTSNQYTIITEPSFHENDKNIDSSSLSSSSLQTMYNDLKTKSFENLVPYNYRICSHSCMMKLIKYLNLHYD